MKAHSKFRVLRFAPIVLSALGLVSCLATYRPGYSPHPVRPGQVVHRPGLVLISGTGIYWASDVSGDVFFYDGRWYWCDGPYWYGAASWGEPWSYVARPPAIFMSIPVNHPRHYVVDQHPNHPKYAEYRQTVSARFKAVPQRREFAEIRGVITTKHAPNPAPKTGPEAERPDRGPKGNNDDSKGRHGGHGKKR